MINLIFRQSPSEREQKKLAPKRFFSCIFRQKLCATVVLPQPATPFNQQIWDPSDLLHFFRILSTSTLVSGVHGPRVTLCITSALYSAFFEQGIFAMINSAAYCIVEISCSIIRSKLTNSFFSIVEIYAGVVPMMDI